MALSNGPQTNSLRFNQNPGAVHWPGFRAYASKKASARHAASLPHVALPAAKHYHASWLDIYFCDNAMAGYGSWPGYTFPWRRHFSGLVLV
jgi:hypothetical protein